MTCVFGKGKAPKQCAKVSKAPFPLNIIMRLTPFQPTFYHIAREGNVAEHHRILEARRTLDWLIRN